MHFLIKKFLKWLLSETIVILYQVVNKNIFVFSPFYTYAYLGIILNFLAGFLLLCRSICQLFHYVIPLPNESLSHTLLISYHISYSYLHKKRTFPCASLLIFYFFFLSPLHIFRGYPFSVTSCVSCASENLTSSSFWYPSGLIQFQEPQVCQIR